MHRFLAIVLLALLPLQLSWAAVATYCGHDAPARAAHFGHHEHAHHADAAAKAEPMADPGASVAVQADNAPGAMDPDCGHCHGSCSAMLTMPSGVPGALSSAPPDAILDAADGACAPTRPERPQWLPLA